MLSELEVPVPEGAPRALIFDEGGRGQISRCGWKKARNLGFGRAAGKELKQRGYDGSIMVCLQCSSTSSPLEAAQFRQQLDVWGQMSERWQRVGV